MQYRDSRQDVTGLVVNRKVNVPTTYRYTVRAMVDHALRKGAFERIFMNVDAAGVETTFQQPGTNRQLIGMLSCIDQIDLFNRKLREDNGLEPHDTTGRTDLFRRFLYFGAFHAIGSPVIVCEGPTDNIYLRHARPQAAGRLALEVFGAKRLRAAAFRRSILSLRRLNPATSCGWPRAAFGHLIRAASPRRRPGGSHQ